MAFGFEKTQPAWSTKQQLWILAQVSENRTQRDIYYDFTAETASTRPEDVARWEGTFRAFKARLQRLTKDGIDPAIDTESGEPCEFDLGTASGRYNYWIYLAKTTASQSTRVQALQMIEKLAPVDPQDLPDGKMYIGANPKVISLDQMTSDMLVEVVLAACDEKLLAELLLALVRATPTGAKQAFIAEWQKTHPAPPLVETTDQKIRRLRFELQQLTEAEIKIIEDENESLTPEDDDDES